MLCSVVRLKFLTKVSRQEILLPDRPMKPGARVIQRGLLAILTVVLFSSNIEFKKSNDDELGKVSKEIRDKVPRKFCKVTSYSKSKLYGVPNVQKSISRWKAKRSYSGQESIVPYRKRNSLKVCNVNSTDYSMAKLRRSVYERSILTLNNLLKGQDVQLSQILAPRESQRAHTLKSCSKPVSFAFAISSQEGSGKIRGFMIADALNELGHTAVTVFGKEGPLWADPLRELRTCSKLHVCIFVKWDSRSFPRILSECKKRGALAFIDLLDYCDANKKNIVDQWPKEIDGFILQSNFQFQVFKSMGFPNSVILHHHHTNTKLKRNSFKNEFNAVQYIGFTGSRKNSGGIIQNFLDDIEMWGSERDIKLVHIVSNRIRSEKRNTSDIYDQNKYHTGIIESVDVAIVWPKDYSNSEIYFKPITRFIHWLSHGIPTIVYSTQSYIEIAEEFGYPLVAENTEDVLKWLEVLVSNKSFRSQVSRLGIEMAHRFSLQTQVQRYSDIFCRVGYLEAD